MTLLSALSPTAHAAIGMACIAGLFLMGMFVCRLYDRRQERLRREAWESLMEKWGWWLEDADE
jgi:hypothetical protein